MKKIYLLTIVLSFMCAQAQAQEATVQKLIVHMTDGQTVEFLLEDEPVTKFEPGQLIIQTSKESPVIYLLENVQKYTHAGVPQGIDSPIVAPGTILVRQNNEAVAIDGLPDNTNVSIYSADGKLLVSRKAVEGQTTLLPMMAFPQGNYIINAGGTSFKFVKQ